MIFVVDRDGKMVQWWPQHDKLFEVPCGRGPHKIKMSPYDPEKHVWVFDDQLHVIHKFTYDGKLVMTLGTKGQRGRDAGKLFDRPTDIAWLPDGTFFISDGYGGTRVAKFDKDGKFLHGLGHRRPIRQPRAERVEHAHAIAISKDRRLFIVDRGHRRIQVFDENGKFLDMWPNIRRAARTAHPADQFLWVADGGTMRMLKYDLNGKLPLRLGLPGAWPGGINGPHSLTVDQEGNLYIGRGVRRPRAEVPAEAGRRSREAHGPAATASRDQLRPGAPGADPCSERLMRSVVVIALLLLATAPVRVQNAPPPELPFESIADPLKLPNDIHFGEVAGVAVNSQGHVFVFSRGNVSGPAYMATAAQLLEFDPDGKFVREIGKNLTRWSYAHGVRIDQARQHLGRRQRLRHDRQVQPPGPRGVGVRP